MFTCNTVARSLFLFAWHPLPPRWYFRCFLSASASMHLWWWHPSYPHTILPRLDPVAVPGRGCPIRSRGASKILASRFCMTAMIRRLMNFRLAWPQGFLNVNLKVFFSKFQNEFVRTLLSPFSQFLCADIRSASERVNIGVQFTIVHHKMHLMFVGFQYGHQRHQSLRWGKHLINIRQQPTVVLPGLWLTLVFLPQLVGCWVFRDSVPKLFCAQTAEHFQATTQTLYHSSNFALKLASQMRMAAQIGHVSSNFTFP